MINRYQQVTIKPYTIFTVHLTNNIQTKCIKTPALNNVKLRLNFVIYPEDLQVPSAWSNVILL